EVDAIKQVRLEGAEPKIALVVARARRCRARVGDAHPGAAALAPARDREAGVAETEDEQPLAGERDARGPGQELECGLAHHLSLSVERPKSTSIMVMIQKRTTTWLSFQPSSS